MQLIDVETEIVNYDGVCPICGSVDGTIILGKDGRYRNMCRFMGCPAMYHHAPAVGFDTEDNCRHPFDTSYLKDGTVTVQEYLTGKTDGDKDEVTYDV